MPSVPFFGPFARAYPFPIATIAASLTLATTLSSSPAAAQAESTPLAQAPSPATPAAICYIAISPAGIYQEPNLPSTSQSSLRPGHRLWVGAGGNYDWLRMIGPQVGWVHANAVQPGDVRLCANTPIVEAVTLANPQAVPQTIPPAGSPALAAPPTPASAPSPNLRIPPDRPGWTACEVLPSAAVYLHEQPIRQDRTIVATFEPGRHLFKVDRSFIDSTETKNLHWIHITEPRPGWILTGTTQSQGRPEAFVTGAGCGFGVG
ncbi:MAG: hypothetical protein ACO331_08110 [Prochlorothrix sp.]